MELVFNKRSKLKTALEFIEFQHDGTGNSIEALVTIIAEKIKDGTYPHGKDINGSKDIEGIVNLIKKRFGLKFEIICDEWEASVFPFQANVHNIFMHPWYWGSSSAASNMKEEKHKLTKGTVNVSEAYVTGVFSEHLNILYVNFHTLICSHKLTVTDITAIILHELGHAFYACEYADRLESTNQILSDVFLEVTKRKEKADAKYIYREVKRLDPEIKEEEIDSLLSDNKVIAGYNWFKLFVGVINSQMPNSLYDNTSFEASADNFSSRFGYGREQILVLQKLNKIDGINLGKNAAFWSYASSLIILSAGLVLMVTSVITLPLVTTMSICFYVSLIFTAALSDNSQSFWFKEYDEVKERYKRIRNDEVNMLKSKNIPEKQALNAIETIKIMDKILNETGEKKSVFSQLAYLISSEERQTVREIDIQRQLESLTSNDLFLKSAELQHA